MKSDSAIGRALENSRPLVGLGKSLVDAAVASVAMDTGRTTEEQQRRMGDRYAYLAVEQNPSQKQLDDYELSGDTVEVSR